MSLVVHSDIYGMVPYIFYHSDRLSLECALHIIWQVLRYFLAVIYNPPWLLNIKNDKDKSYIVRFECLKIMQKHTTWVPIFFHPF